MHNVKSRPVESQRDTRGPGRAGVDKLLAVAGAQGGEAALRDTAIVRMLWGLGLRREELVRIDVSDVDFNNSGVWILGKKRLQKERISVPPLAMEALRAWIRDRRSGPVFTTLHRGYKKQGRRLRGDGLWDVIVRLGKKCGMKVWPHGIRHAAITEVLDASNGNIRAAQKFSRHKDKNMLDRYDDNRTDMAGAMSNLIDGRVGAQPDLASAEQQPPLP